MEKIKKWEIYGAILSIISGSLLHFVFEWSGGLKVVALFGAVNESTWEHLKLAFWPTFVFSCIEYFVISKNVKNFCFATFIKLSSMPIIIVVMFYAWLALFPDNFIYDISTFIIAVVAGYMLSYKIMNISRNFSNNILYSALIVILLAIFSLFTYYPPKSFLTKDPIGGGYGINK